MTRRSYALTLAACLLGAALSLYAITRTWSVHLTPRTGMSALREARTGTDLEPWVTALAVAALAGTGALLATAGRLRRALGVVLALAGAGVLIGAVLGRAGLDPGSAGAGATFWPIACGAGGLLIAMGGVTAARQGHLWPRMSARYDRNPVPPSRSAADTPLDSSVPAADHRATWDALDRGDDPTA
jgi:uncharacterized membrane protein (TIGR02234 family)